MTSAEKKGEVEDIDNFNAIQDPNTLAALQEKLGQMTVKAKPEVDELDLPPFIMKRVNAIKNLQLQATKIEAEFFKQVHKLEIEYAEKYAPLYKRRAEIVAGDVEPSPTECVFPGEEADNDNEAQDNDNESVSGIPGFWLTIFKNTEILAEMTQPHDEGILESLTDIRVSFPDSGMGFVLEFVFRENEFFEDKTLTKTYHMKSESDECDPVAFDGPEIVGSTGCNINWKKGKNVTQKVVKKKQRMKGKGQTRIIQKTIKEDSFFNFFAPPSMPEDDSESVDEELEALLTTDFEIGQYIRERIVPKAIWYFTNEVTDLESDIDDEASDDDYSDSSDYEDELENNENVVANETVTDVQKPEDCKQQ